MIKDSGERRSFESGGVRDIQDGKGRCDLLPLDCVAGLLNETSEMAHDVLNNISMYQETGDAAYIYAAISIFIENTYDDFYTAILEVALHYEEGAKKYAERNWQLGLPQHCFIDSGVRHFLKWCRGDDDERHDSAFIWNMLGAVWTAEHKKDLKCYPIEEKFL